MFHGLKNKSKGQSLTEIMMAVLIFGIIAVGLSLPVANSIFATRDNKNINTASNLARSYLKDVQDSWELQSNFDIGNLITLDGVYTDSGNYTVSATTQDIKTDDDGNVLVRRLNIVYEDEGGNMLCDIYFDYNRPGSI